MTLIDQPRLKGMGGKFRPTNEDILLDTLFQLANGFRIEAALNLCPASGYNLQSLGVHDFISSLPELGELALEGRLGGQGRVTLPHHHGLIHAPPIEMRADGAHEVGDEAEVFLLRRCPVEIARPVFGVAVE